MLGEIDRLNGPAGRDIVIVHSSDIHVDDGYTARVHGGDGARGLECVLDTARALSADAVLLAGDVFEHNRLPDPLLERAAGLLEDCGIPVVMLPGNHDPLTADSAYRRCGMGEAANVHILGLTHDAAVRFPELDLGSYPFYNTDKGTGVALVVRGPDRARIDAAATEIYAFVEELGGEVIEDSAS